jgi:hypothetical protein
VPLFTPEVSLDNPDEINGLVEKVNPAGADVILIEDSASGYAKNKIQLSRVCPAATLATATGDTTTSSGTDVLVSGMTLTPEAGTYLVTFSGSITNGTSGRYTHVSLWYNGSQIASSEQRYFRGGSQRNDVPFCCQAKIVANGSLAVEGRWRTTSGSTGTMFQRVLSVVKVS